MCALRTWSAGWDGDEFGLLMWHVAPQLAEAKARELERLIERLAVPHSGAVLSVGASAGIAPLSRAASAPPR